MKYSLKHFCKLMDHIGSVAWFQENTNCKIYTSEGEKRWIEDLDLQFKERLDVKVIGTPGHSVDEQASRDTLKRILMMSDIETYYPAWDYTYSKEEMKKKLDSAEELLDMLKNAVGVIDNGMD